MLTIVNKFPWYTIVIHPSGTIGSGVVVVVGSGVVVVVGSGVVVVGAGVVVVGI